MAISAWMRALPWLVLAACSTSDRFADGGNAPDGGPGPGDAQTADAGSSGGKGSFGAACERSQDCRPGLFCDTQIDLGLPASDLPPGLDEIPSNIFPGGVCTPVPRAPYDPTGADSCDPVLPQAAQGCGRDGACVAVTLDTGEQVVACRPTCDPTQGCGRFGYACDFDLKACVEGCQSDEECRLLLLDEDGDGRADALAYDDTSRATCDTESFRCVHPGGSDSGVTGDACTKLDDCEAEGLCLEELRQYAGLEFPGGYCTKFGCQVEGRECEGEGSVCEPLRPMASGVSTGDGCWKRCTVGAEPEADRVGRNGHGEGCRPGYRCHYNGGEGPESGVCVGGNYNAVAENNVGAECQTDADCYSPFGLGACVRLRIGPSLLAPVSTCAIMDCSAPGLPEDVCGDNGECIGLYGDIAFCVQTCKQAEDCATGYSCTDDDLNPATARICYPACFEDGDCRKGEEVCRARAAGEPGMCVASGN